MKTFIFILSSSLILLNLGSGRADAKVVDLTSHVHHLDKSKNEKSAKNTSIKVSKENEHHILYAHLIMLLR